MPRFDPESGMSRSEFQKDTIGAPGALDPRIETRTPDITHEQIQDMTATANAAKKRMQGAGNIGSKVDQPQTVATPERGRRQPTPRDKPVIKPPNERGVTEAVPSEQIIAPRTFAQAGTREFGQRGYQGAIFSPHSKFAMNPGIGGNAMAKGQPMISRLLQQTMAAGQPGGATLMGASSPMGGLPTDGGLVDEGGGEQDLEQILMQMMAG